MAPKELKLGSWRATSNTTKDMSATINNIKTIKFQVAANLNKYQDETQRWKNKKIKSRAIKEGDLVLFRVPKGKMKGKMNSKWDGPFLIAEMVMPEACMLRRYFV